jgi:hypothetical protein
MALTIACDRCTAPMMCDQCHQPLFIAPANHVCEPALTQRQPGWAALPRPRKPKTHRCRGGDCRLHAASAELVERLRRRIRAHYATLRLDETDAYRQCICYDCVADRALIDQLTHSRGEN